MATYRELTYLVLDELKVVSDDAHFTEEHVMFLLDKYRSFLLKQRYSDVRKEIPESNYQTICLCLEDANAVEGTDCNGDPYLSTPCNGLKYRKSIKQVPTMLSVGKQTISSVDFFQGNLAYVNNERFKYVGNNKYLKNQIYGTIAPNRYLYLKSNNPQAYYLEKVKVTGIFEDSSAAAELQCDSDNGDGACDIMDKNFPIEEALIPPMIELIVKELSGHLYQPKDSENNDSDDLSKLANYIARNLKERRS